MIILRYKLWWWTAATWALSIYAALSQHRITQPHTCQTWPIAWYSLSAISDSDYLKLSHQVSCSRAHLSSRTGICSNSIFARCLTIGFANGFQLYFLCDLIMVAIIQMETSYYIWFISSFLSWPLTIVFGWCLVATQFTIVEVSIPSWVQSCSTPWQSPGRPAATSWPSRPPWSPAPTSQFLPQHSKSALNTHTSSLQFSSWPFQILLLLLP